MEIAETKQVSYSNMNYDDFLKLKAVVLFVIEKCSLIDKIHLFKIIYFANIMHYAAYGKRIVNDSFYAMEYGPVPSALYDAVKIADGGEGKISNNKLLLLISEVISVTNNQLKAKEHPDMDELSSTNICYLTQSIRENKDLSFDELSHKSHDLAWIEAWTKRGGTKILDEYSMARAGGASDDMIAFIKEQKDLDTLFAE